MKLSEALAIIDRPKTGYIVKFEYRENGMVRSDFFPDVESGEPGIHTLDGAWLLAGKLAKANSEYVNIHVGFASNFKPVPEYHTIMLNKLI